MTTRTRARRGSFAAFWTIAGALAACAADEPRDVGRGCPPERAQNGEVRLVFLADSGYGGGFSEWGTHGQQAVASQINRLRLPPDLVFFLGDNVYWRGSASLYKSRFDDMYDPLIRECKAHVALGNHDVKGCRLAEDTERWQSCVEQLQTAFAADRKARYMRQGLDEQKATEKAEADAAAGSKGEAGEKALAARRANCLAGDATAYTDDGQGGTCNATAALSHAQFGFGSVVRGDESERQRYYSILWPLPKLAPKGSKSQEPATQPLVEVIVLDSNTLDTRFDADDGGLPPPKEGGTREDQLQMLWFRSAMAEWLPAAGEPHRVWKIVAFHHPVYTPRACACKLFGHCIGGHADELGMRDQLARALEDLAPPDLVMTAHNHIYARSHPLDPKGEPVATGTGGVRYFVTGGGGAPLYAVDRPDPRFAKAETRYHFVYMRLTGTSAFFWVMDARGKVRDSGCFDKGSNVDHALRADFQYDDALPTRCGPQAP